MGSIPKNVYPLGDIEFDPSFSQKDRNYYYALITRTAYEYWRDLKDYDLWRTPYKVIVKLGSGEGLADHDTVIVRLPHKPNFWQAAAVANTVGHEFGHMYVARMYHREKPAYGWGGTANREPGNYIHHADGLNEFEGDARYIKTHWLVDWKKLRIMRLAIFDILRLFADHEIIMAHVRAHLKDERWDYHL